MRKVIDPQMKIGEKSISDIQFDLHSRDEIPELLRELQAIFCDRDLREQIFEVLTELIPSHIDQVPSHIDQDKGRKGMSLWTILVPGTLRLNWDYDKLLEISNNHVRVRQMLGHGPMDEDYRCSLQTLRDNIALFTPEILNKINQILVKYGHKTVGRKQDEVLRGSCDSFVVETDVHFPTDVNLLFDAVRKMISLNILNFMTLTPWF